MTPTPTSSEQDTPHFWCHECSDDVETRVDDENDEVCCTRCGGNFVEEIQEDDPPQNFRVEQAEDGNRQTSADSIEDNAPAQIRNELEGTHPLPR
ncbi:hypothetical protein PsorP6_003933 [Peronosclerospora sorghi]|uniref:Uncharacterized protein n=1 Tax=Peronosclerospora sorghi TaxID=230839 RepID=A0ACC0VKW1_9STRA|nr:hypothetical protein PsorP6_003933 [Peronosclerospora sorghi]